MKVIAVYRQASDHRREVEGFIKEVERRTGLVIEVRNPDHKDNQMFLRAYDIVEYPTLLAISSSGSILAFWKGQPLPTIDEISCYAR